MNPDEQHLLALWRSLPELDRADWLRALEQLGPRPAHDTDRLLAYPPLLGRLLNAKPAAPDEHAPVAVVALPLLARWLACRGVKPAEALASAWSAARTTAVAIVERVIAHGLQGRLAELWDELELAGALPERPGRGR